MSTDGPIEVLCVNTRALHGADRPEGAGNGITTEFVTRGEEARSYLSGTVCDCLLVGADLPETGLERFLRDLRDAHPGLPALVSGVAGERAERVLEAGATDIVHPDATAGSTDVLINRIRNVVEQHRARQADRGREYHLPSLLEHSSDRLSVLDEDGRYTFVSPAVEHLVGYGSEELLGASPLEYVHPDDRDRVRDVFQRIIDTPGDTRRVEYRFRDADGDWRWVESRGTNRLEDPAIEGVVVSSRDVTDRKTHQDDLREERALTEAIFAGLPDVFYAFDDRMNFLRWNDRLTDVTGYSDEEIASMHPVELVVEEDREKIREGIDQVIENDETATVEARFETKAGETIPYEFTGAKMTDDDGELLGLVGTGRDISDRKERQRRFEAVFNNTYQFTGLLDPDGTLLEANQTALEFGNLDRDDVIGEKVWETYWFQDNDEARRTAREAVERARAGSFYRKEIEVQGAERTEIIDFSVRPITDEQGEVTLLIPEGRTITALKQREQHLNVLHRFLRHNLRNKMTVIEGSADILTREADLAEEHARNVTRIREAATALTELSETAYELSQIATAADGDHQPVDIDRTLESVGSDLREKYPSASLSIRSETGRQVRADWRLRAVFDQLVENAIEHTEQDRPAVTVTATTDDDSVTVRIADDGPGIPDDELVGIVTDEDQTQLTHGTGFGLWLVRLVIDDYGGDISYESPPDSGSVISVTLPSAAGHSDPREQADEIERA